MIGKTVDDIRPPVPMKPEDDPLDAGNKYTPDTRPGPRARPGHIVAEALRPQEAPEGA